MSRPWGPDASVDLAKVKRVYPHIFISPVRSRDKSHTPPPLPAVLPRTVFFRWHHGNLFILARVSRSARRDGPAQGQMGIGVPGGAAEHGVSVDTFRKR